VAHLGIADLRCENGKIANNDATTTSVAAGLHPRRISSDAAEPVSRWKMDRHPWNYVLLFPFFCFCFNAFALPLSFVPSSLPELTPSSVVKLLPSVSTVTSPDLGAFQDHHSDLPPAFPPCLGSPTSFVAPTLVPVVVGAPPARVIRLAKLSFGGPVGVGVGTVVICWMMGAERLPLKLALPE